MFTHCNVGGGMNGTYVVFHRTGQPLEHRTGVVPALCTGEVLVRNSCTTLCRSDVNTWCGKRRETTPTILGHEIVGRIENLGAAAPATDLRGRPLRVGDRVTWAVWASDPSAPMAARGLPQKAPGLFKYGHELLTDASGFHGGLAQFTLLRRNTPIVRLDEAVPDTIAAPISCAFATVAGALRLAGDLTDRTVIVSGTGMLGLIACAMAKCTGASAVAAIDVDETRLSRAPEFGAERVELIPWTAFGASTSVALAPADVVFEFSGVSAAVETSLSLLTTGGIAVWVGSTHPDRPARIDAERVVRQMLTIRGLHNYNTQDLVTAVEFVERHHATFPFASLVRADFRLAEAEQAFRCALVQQPFRVGIRHGPAGGAP